MFTRILFLILISLFGFSGVLTAATVNDPDLRQIEIQDTGNDNDQLGKFMEPVKSFFFAPDPNGGQGVMDVFIMIAFQAKNFFIAVAIIFLIVGVIRLIFSSNDEEELKKWRYSIIWVSVGIMVMQIAFSVWNTLLLKSPTDKIGSSLGWEVWINIFSPVVQIFQTLASFGFLAMAIYAFFIRVSAGGDEEKLKKSTNSIIYGVTGFLLIQIPYMIVKAFYGRPGCENSASNFINVGACDIKEVDLGGGIGIIGKVFTYFNTFLSLICVLLVIYAGWLVFISGGDEEKLKKAKHIVLYIILGFIVLVASHALFRFFILKG